VTVSTTSKTTTEAPAAEDKIVADALANSLTGFDQLAIQKYFGLRFDQIGEDPTMFLRALWFVTLRRGPAKPKDADAYREAMGVSLGDLTAKFETAPDLDEDRPEEAADEGFADFVIGTGLNYTFAQYMELSVHQRAKIIAAANKRNRRKG
jgi:hypothetical protein